MPRLLPILFVLLCLQSVPPVLAQEAGGNRHLVETGAVDSLYSEVLGEQRAYWIHLPGGGDLTPGKSYPVIYLLDGSALLGGLAMVQEFYNYFRLPEMIVVAISNQTHRTRDLTPTPVAARHGAPVDESGGAERFASFLTSELIPHIESAYPTLPHRTLIGHSYAGLFTLDMMINRPGHFRNYVAIDPSIDWDDGVLLRQAEASFQSDDHAGTGLFISVANEILRFSDTHTIDTVEQDTSEYSLGIRSNLALVRAGEAARSNGLRFDWKFYEKDLHGSVPLVSMIDGLVFLYDWWELKSPSLYNDPATPTETIVGMIRARSESLTANMGVDMAMDEGLLTMLGFMSIQMDQPDKARAVFGLLLEYYPRSADAHEALSEFHEWAGEPKEARCHAARAVELARTDVRN